MARFDDVDLSSVGYFLPRGPLPDGDYLVRVSDSQIRDYFGEKQLSLTLDVARGEYAGRKLWINLRLWHNDRDRKRRDAARLKTLARACGHPNPDMMKDSMELHGRTMYVTVKNVERNGKEYQNVENYRLPPEDERADARPMDAVPVPPDIFGDEGFEVAKDAVTHTKDPWDAPAPVVNGKKPSAPWEAWD